MDPKKRAHFFIFLEKVLSREDPEISNTECLFLPLLKVHNPKKPDQIKGVFHLSAEFENISVNKVLNSGPYLTNNLVGILMQIRENAKAISWDIQQMLYAFHVHEKHRDHLRYFWHETMTFRDH